ncbi:MAG TPA: Ku protein [Gammaproteobacteria bacterium]|nr:Ku protein [Gammaproteobacteria bacterium]
MARAIWKGSISFGLVNIPVQLFSAEKPSEQLHFHLLDKKTHTRIHNQRVNEMGQEVPWDEIDHAYEFQKGKYVIVNQKMLEKAAAANYETVEIAKFVPFAQIDPVYLAKPYYLIPTESGLKGYTLLHDILKRTKSAGIATVVIKTREHIAAIIPQDDYLTLIILRYAKELHALKEFAALTPKTKSKLKITPKEIALAEQLVSSMSGKWQPEKYLDNSNELLRKLINADIKKGKAISKKAKTVAKSEKVLDFAELLKKSVAAKEKRKRG